MINKYIFERLQPIYNNLGITLDSIVQRNLPFYSEAHELVLVETGEDGKEYLLTPSAVHNWCVMREKAKQEGIVLSIVSAFRSVERQTDLIQRKLDRGQSIDEILCLLAPPGCSEHHSGRALDLCTQGCAPASEEFDRSEAFAWLMANANNSGFYLSFPRNNPEGFVYEPWHWCYREEQF